VRKVGSDVSHRLPAQDEEGGQRSTRVARRRVRNQACVAQDCRGRAASIPVVPFPGEGAEIADSPRLTLVLADPEAEWSGGGSLREQIAQWTRQRGTSPRLYPAALVWCLKKPGRELRDKAELMLAWKRVVREVAEFREGGSGGASVEICGAAQRICRRRIHRAELAPALKDSGAWSLASLRQSFLSGSLTRLVDPTRRFGERSPICRWRGLRIGIGRKSDGAYERVWFEEPLAAEEVAFEANVFLLRKEEAQALKSGTPQEPEGEAPSRLPEEESGADSSEVQTTVRLAGTETVTLQLVGTVPPEVWNRLGTKILPKLRSGTSDLKVGVDFSVTVSASSAATMASELRQILEELELAEKETIIE
jgi:hypothetical protein